jgi:predicted ATPase
MVRRRPARLCAPLLKRVWLDPGAALPTGHPFDLLWLGPGFAFVFDEPVTILVGENGVGKSTLVEAIAALAGFGPGGGSKAHRGVVPAESAAVLGQHVRGAWLPKVTEGWFFRAETFHALTGVLADAAAYRGCSHGEAFLRLFADRMAGGGLFVIDEPESALSPRHQAMLLRFLAEIQAEADAQVILATHSPILMAVPGARLWRITHRGMSPTDLRATDHFRLLSAFTADPDGFVAAVCAGDIDTLL